MSSRFTLLVLVIAAALLGGRPSHAASDKPAGTAPAASQASAAPARLVDINSASRAQLKTLPGIGDAEADRIIAARPYPSKAKLGADKVVSDQTYFAIKGLIVAVQPAATDSKTDSKASAKR
jgi:DNA uptake protein ComE-like DNA-binding protein